MSKKIIVIISVLLLSIILLGCKAITQAKTEKIDSKSLKVVMLDVGQGDSLLIQTDGKNILVDTGKIEQRSKLVEKLKKYGVSTIDLLIATHPHEDHIGGIQAVLDNFIVKEIYDSGAKSSSKLYANYLKKVKDKKIKFVVPKEGEVLAINDSVKLEFLTRLKNQPQELIEDVNNNSIVFRLVSSNFTMLFTGDIEKQVEKILVEQQQDKLKSDILKAPHHGSKTSSSKDFLKAVAAKDVLISAAQNNEYKHPHQEVVNRYKSLKENMYLTADTGDILIESSGASYKISTER